MCGWGWLSFKGFSLFSYSKAIRLSDIKEKRQQQVEILKHGFYSDTFLNRSYFVTGTGSLYSLILTGDKALQIFNMKRYVDAIPCFRGFKTCDILFLAASAPGFSPFFCSLFFLV
jgi:hypothetical protein